MYTPLAVVSHAGKVSTLSTTAPNSDAKLAVSWKEGAAISTRKFHRIITDIRHRNKSYLNFMKTIKLKTIEIAITPVQPLLELAALISAGLNRPGFI
jgi:hypothetical protein